MDFGSWIQGIIATTNLPFLAAFLVGLLASIGPCPLATNVTALSYTAQQFTDRRAVVATGVLYTLGRAIAYGLVGLVVLWPGRGWANWPAAFRTWPMSAWGRC